ncbi:hypothetical protein [Flammeovirga sp. EKP202]|uniref:hypothetical protein n=1 Tax=Flammeovirga sp. EKP202 TaxID=2770592 RepID=UPI00165FDC6C|nr:hypothetical protein [Flammeovirga sp. EKP202]MBD0405310.1 hypothetical protein [Flammeovirga sp. EKP202]
MKSQVEEHIIQGSEEWGNSNFSAARDHLNKAWNSLSEPKESEGESFHIAKYLIMVNLELKDFELALKWANQMQTCHMERGDDGDREFWRGKVLYESGKTQEARNEFITANKKSFGRCFIDEDIKYKELIVKVDEPLDFKAVVEKADHQFLKGEFSQALKLFFDSLNFEEALDNPFVHLRKGQCHFELQQLDKSADSLTRAYMLEGKEIFEDEEPKYIEFLKTKIKT